MRFIVIVSNPVFTIGQLQRLSNIFDNAGQVIFGIAVLSPIIPGIDKVNLLVVILSLLTVIFCWLISVWLAKKGEGV